MKIKWEYQVLTWPYSSLLRAKGGTYADTMTRVLNDLGEQGWELAAISPQGAAVYKRQVTS